MLNRQYYFLGVDPAPAFGKKADDGALIGAKVWPRSMDVALTNNPADWHFGYVWAYRMRGASLEEWSGFVHKKHREFGFTKILLDNGAGGGGGFLMRQLRNGHQLIDQVQTMVKPIVTTDETVVFDGHPILHMLRRRDPAIAQMWPLLAGDDNLVDACHTAFRQAVDRAGIAFPPAFDEVPREVASSWAEEVQWSSKLLHQVTNQLINVQVATNTDGTWQLTNHGAKQFSAIGKKDMAYAAIYCYVAFLIWLVTGDFTQENPGDAVGFGGF